ncbi:MAG TPA: purine-nucleoside phosphorylase [Candidatus Hydrogenedentes bacterium]|nr:purine-nucleoside phosphorylase [Candidatus Hydrogenedentota bacterium]HQH53480.1 purine-nucleoside phosphorylase [Candidatus Hydrogenedentota bacterium]
MVSELRQQIEESVQVIRAKCSLIPKVAVILGTGLNGLTDRLELEARLSYEVLPHFAVSTVESHAGELLLGHLGGKPVAAMSGRFHRYEGYSLKQVTFPVRVMRALGAQVLVAFNAAGGLNPQFRAGDLMVIEDHINFMGDNPLIGPNDDTLGPRFPDMSEPYTRELIELAETVAMEKGIRLQKGVYLACPGPSLETRAEYRMMRGMGADVVGMSTVPEVIVAVHGGMKVLAFSVVTDECFPDALKPVEIERIIAIASEAEPKLTQIVSACVERMPV